MPEVTTPAEVLAFETRTWIRAGAKEQAITANLGISPTRYYQLMRDALLDPEACAAHPSTAARLHRILFQRQTSRPATRWAG